MSDVPHRPGVHEAYMVKRHLKLETLEGDKAEAIAQEVDQLVGVDTVALDRETRRLDIAYDASVLQIETIVRRHGSDRDHGWWTRFKDGWYRYIDQQCQLSVDSSFRPPRSLT
jgi:hypothetical protein